MCKAKEHVFLWTSTNADIGPPIGMLCLCGLYRWGSEAELRALDEIAELERVLALPAKEPS